MKIQILNNNFMQIIEGAEVLKPMFEYEQEFWKQGRFSRERKPFLKSMINREGLFLCGFFEKINSYCKRNNIELEVDGELEKITPLNIDLKEYRDTQKEAISKATFYQRGVIKFATGSGKTRIAKGIYSSFEKANKLFLVQSKSILEQTKKRFEESGLKVDCYTNIKFSNMLKKDESLKIFYDVIIVDECHHVNKVDSTYGKILSQMLAPVKIGLTGSKGSMPKDRYGNLCLEGLLGPVLAELKMADAIDLGILSKPKITLLPIKKKISLAHKYYSYRDIYQNLVVESKIRNIKIIKLAMKRVLKNKTVLIIVNIIDHGVNLKLVADKFNFKVKFIQGATDSKTREKVKELLIDKKIKCVICTDIWREGVDIPTLDVFINAAGGKSEKRTIQQAGRVMRRSKDKNKAEIVDILDPYRYLAEHTVERLIVYKKERLL